MSEIANYLAIARLARYNHQKRAFKISSRGDGLQLLETQERLKLYLPPHNEKNLTAPSTRGLDPAGLMIDVELLELTPDKQSLKLEWDHNRFTPEELTGSWLLLSRERFENNSEGIYAFQLLECDVREESDGESRGKIIDYFETAAHGIVTIQLNDGTECMVPVVDEHLKIEIDKKVVVVENLADFLV